MGKKKGVPKEEPRKERVTVSDEDFVRGYLKCSSMAQLADHLGISGASVSIRIRKLKSFGVPLPPYPSARSTVDIGSLTALIISEGSEDAEKVKARQARLLKREEELQSVLATISSGSLTEKQLQEILKGNEVLLKLSASLYEVGEDGVVRLTATGKRNLK